MVWDTKNGNRVNKRAPQEVVTSKVEFDHSHVYRFDLLSEWANTIRVIREKLALHRNSQLLSDIVVHILDIRCKNEGKDDIVLHFNMRDLYLVGFSLGGVIYEFGLKDQAQILPSSMFLGYGSGYLAMGARNLTSINIGYPSFTNALIEMINGTRFEGHTRRIWMNDIRTRIPTVLVMLPECVRFKWHYLAVSQLMTELKQGDTSRVSYWMARGINNWHKASVVAFQKERTDRTKLPPSGEIHKYDLPDMDRALEDWVWATDLLAVHCLLEPIEPRHVLRHESVGNGDKEVPHLFVLWNNKEVGWQTESYMKLNFPYFDTRCDTFPTPPQPRELIRT